jgi:hypothetical protein
MLDPSLKMFELGAVICTNFCWTINEMTTSPNQLKLLDAIGQCKVANMVLESEVLSLNHGGCYLSK